MYLLGERILKYATRQGNAAKMTAGMHTAFRSFVEDTLQRPVSQQLMMHGKVMRLPRSRLFPPSCLRPYHMWKNYGRILVPVCWGSCSALIEVRCHKGGAPGEVRPQPGRILGSKGSVFIGGSARLRRTFGGQSVVPWELALFLVEEVRGTVFARFPNLLVILLFAVAIFTF